MRSLTTIRPTGASQNLCSPNEDFGRIDKRGKPDFRSLCSPNEDFGRPNKHFRTRLRSTFQRFVAQIEYSRPWKVLRKRVLKGFFGLPKSSFGRGKVLFKGASSWYMCMCPNWPTCEHSHHTQLLSLSGAWNLPLPNEDFGRLNQPFRMCFRSTFQQFVAQKQCSLHWKVPRKRILKGLFGLPKSSFGEHKIAQFVAQFTAL
jgi:hypothetical protein